MCVCMCVGSCARACLCPKILCACIRTHPCAHVCVYESMYLCMYVCMHVRREYIHCIGCVLAHARVWTRIQHRCMCSRTNAYEHVLQPWPSIVYAGTCILICMNVCIRAIWANVRRSDTRFAKAHTQLLFRMSNLWRRAICCNTPQSYPTRSGNV
jgi:hypothetical protein